MTGTEESANAPAMPARSGGESSRVVAARSRADDRLRRQRESLRPLGWVVLAAVAISSSEAHPGPALHGRGLAVTIALVAFATALAVAISPRFPSRAVAIQAGVITAAGAAGVALTALQPRGATTLAGGVAVWFAVLRLPLVAAAVLAGAVTVGLDLAAALSGSSSAAVLATTLLCALLALVAYFLKQGRADQDRTELLLAQLQDAREEQTRAAATAERARIAGELHDVLAHSLSGAALQLQSVRLLAEREQAEPRMRASIERASELVKDGLTSARQAVGALRGDELPGVGQLGRLVEDFRRDMNVEVTLTSEGAARTLPAEAGLALYRGTQEALTNVARYAPGASIRVILRYEADRTRLSVEDWTDEDGGQPAGVGGLSGVGGGRGLSGLRERLDRLGGSLEAGPSPGGWRVEMEVPG